MTDKYDWKDIHDKIIYHFRLRSLPVVLKYYKKKEEMTAVPEIVLTNKQCVPCLAIGQAAILGNVVGITSENFIHNYCRTVHGFRERDEKWLSAKPFVGRWLHTAKAAQAHHRALTKILEKYEGFAVAPLHKGIIKNPDACVMYTTPEQAFWILASSVNVDYKKHNFTFVGESTCNDAWIRTLVTGETGIGIGSYGERIFGSLSENELVISMKIEFIIKAFEGADNMKNGRERLCYPIPAFSLVGDISTVKNPAFKGY